MQVIPYNPATDPWFQLGRAVSGGLGLLANNRMARGEAKNQDKEFANDEANKYNGFLDQTKAMMGFDKGDSTGWASGNAKLSAMGYNGPALTPTNAEGINAGLLKQQDYWNQYKDINAGKRLHDDDYLTYNQYKANMPGLLG